MNKPALLIVAPMTSFVMETLDGLKVDVAFEVSSTAPGLAAGRTRAMKVSSVPDDASATGAR